MKIGHELYLYLIILVLAEGAWSIWKNKEKPPAQSIIRVPY